MADRYTILSIAFAVMFLATGVFAAGFAIYGSMFADAPDRQDYREFMRECGNAWNASVQRECLNTSYPEYQRMATHSILTPPLTIYGAAIWLFAGLSGVGIGAVSLFGLLGVTTHTESDSTRGGRP